MRVRKRWVQALIIAATTGLAWALFEAASFAGGQTAPAPSWAQSSTVFTPAHRTVLEAIKEFFAWRSTPVQPIAFTHKVHLANKMQCTDCHTSVEKGPVASIPGVKQCMMCHQVIATDRPEIKRVAAYLERTEEIPWQRVYAYYPSAHVKFHHAAHLRAGIDCSSCHGDMTQQTVAIRAINLTMGYCIDCHKQKKVSIDCTTCHF